jgi:hypothetical protein
MQETTRMFEKAPLFSVGNHHAAGSGQPPHVDGDTAGRYHGYFENEHGERAVFVYDYQAQKGTVRLGDAGWERAFRVTGGRAPELILNEAEAPWLRGCWLAATAFSSRSQT